MRFLIVFLSIFLFTNTLNAQSSVLNTFPDGSAVSPWFLNSTKIQLKSLGKRFTITKFGVKKDSTLVQTKAIQHIIDDAAAQGGGVIVIPKGTFLSYVERY